MFRATMVFRSASLLNRHESWVGFKQWWLDRRWWDADGLHDKAAEYFPFYLYFIGRRYLLSTMSTSNQQRASGRRQAFGDLHENTIPSAKSIAASTPAKATADSKKKIRASTSSSLLTRSHSKKNDRSSDQQQRSGSSSSEEDHVVHKMGVGSPTTKNSRHDDGRRGGWSWRFKACCYPTRI